MQNTSVQVRVTLPIQLQQRLQTQADIFGLTMAGYIKNLILDDIKNSVYPVIQASERTEKAFVQAKRSEKDGTLKRVKNLKVFLNEL